MLCKPKLITPHTKFKAQVYCLKKKEGGPSHAVLQRLPAAVLLPHDRRGTGVANLPEGTEMVMPGDNVEMTVELIQPIAMDEGLRFAIREGRPDGWLGGGHRSNRVGAPPTEDLHGGELRVGSPPNCLKRYGDTPHPEQDPNPAQGLRPLGDRDGGQGDRRHGYAHRRVRGPVSLPTEKNVYCVIRAPSRTRTRASTSRSARTSG